MNNADKQYLELGRKIIGEGADKDDRTGTGTRSIFGYQMRFDLSEGFPLLTTKRLPFRVIVEELLWFISGSSDLKDLLDKGVNIWNDDAYRDYTEQAEPGHVLSKDDFLAVVKKGGYNLGPIYGKQWRTWAGIDQLAEVIESIRSNPSSRRHIVSAWNAGDLNAMALPPCHTLFQFYVADGFLSCQLYQRSADYFLGLPFNIASYSLLTHMIAQVTGLKPGEFVHTLGDAHIYRNHIEQVEEQTKRKPRPLPTIKLNEGIDDIDGFTADDIELIGYNPHPTIKGELSVGL